MRNYLPFLTIVAAILLLANSAQHPTNPNGGYTRAPLDGACTECHSNGNNNLSGSFDLIGLPEITLSGESYDLKVLVTNPESDAVRAGFQLVGLESDLSNAGQWASAESDVLLKRARQRNYIGHSPARAFNEDNQVEWVLTWTPEDGDAGKNTIYGAGMIGNGSDGNQGDRALFRQWNTTTYLPEDTLIANIFSSRLISRCRDFMDGQLSIDLIGGIPPYTYLWSTTDTTILIDSLSEGTYTVTITDSIGQIAISEYDLALPEALEIDEVVVSDVTDIETPNGSIELSIAGGNAPYEILWFNIDSIKSIGTGSAIQGLSQGQYFCEVEDITGCILSSDTLLIQLNTSVKEIFQVKTTLYPNPSTDYFIIKADKAIKSLFIYDQKGSLKLIKVVNSNQSKVDFQLSPGIYFVNYNFTNYPDRTQTDKLMVTY